MGMHMSSLWRRCVAGLFAILLLAMAGATARAQSSAEDQGVLAGFLSRLLSTPTSRVTIGAVEGALSSDAVIRDVAIADDQGVFLTIDRIQLVWRRAALLQRRIEVQRLEIGRITLTRKPAATTGAPEPGPLLPELPLALRVDAFTLQELVLGEPVLGMAARLGARGSASLGAPADGLRASLAINRLDAPGTAELAMSFVPQGQRLDVRLTADEPAGGVLARLAQIPGTPPVKLELAGTGVLDDFAARLNFEGGPDIDARGGARLVRSGAERVLTLDIAARVAPLLPIFVQPVFSGVTQLTGDATFADGGGIKLRNLKLAAPLAELTVTGSIGSDRRLELRAAARAVPTDNGATATGRGRLGRLVFDGSARGPIDGPTVEGTLDLAALQTPAFALDALTARFSLTPGSSAMQQAVFEVSAEAKGFSPVDQGIDEAIGRDLRLVLRGDLDADGVARFAEARVSSPNLAVNFDGRVGERLLDGRATVEISRLAAFSRLAGRSLGGRANLEAVLTGDPERNTFAARLSGRTAALRLGDARLERLLGEAVVLNGGVAFAGSTLSLDSVRLSGHAVEARLVGSVSTDRLTLAANVDLVDLRALDDRLSGRASAAARVTGARADPSLVVALSAAEATALGRPVRDLTISIDAASLLVAPSASLAGRGTIGGKPFLLDGNLSAGAGGGWRVDRLDASLGSVALKAEGTLSSDSFADGRVELKAGDLDDISPLALTSLSGRAEATIVARTSGDAGDRRQDVTARAEASRLVAGAVRIASLTADIAADNLYSRPVLRGSARAGGLAAGGLVLDQAALVASDGGGGSSAVTLDARGGGFTIDAAARIQPGPPIAIQLERLRLNRAGRTIALAAPSTLVLEGGSVRTGSLNLNVAGGRVAISGSAGRTLALAVQVTALPLSAAEIVAPGRGLVGVADARATIAGTTAAPEGRFDLTLRNFSLPATRETGLPALTVTAQGTLARGAAELTARINGGRPIALDVTGSVGLGADPRLDLKVKGGLDAALASRRLGAGQRVSGRVAIDAAVAGSPREPRISGSASIAGGSFSDVLRGVAIDGIEGRVAAAGESVTIERLSGRTRGGGPVSITGRIAVAPAQSFPADLRLVARDARLLDSGLARLVANADIAVTGPLASTPRLSGRISILSLDVRVPERLGGASEPLRDARHVAPPAQTRARLAQAARAARPAGRRSAPMFRAALDLAIDAPAGIFVRGRGIDAELGGSLRIGGTTLEPTANGAFDLRRGRLTILTQRLDFSRGRLTFSGAGFVPELDFVAETRAGDVTARVQVTGVADQPLFAFSSSPSLPEDEVLSRLLFQRAAGGLSPLQALQLAQAVAQLSGGGPDTFEGVRRALGVDDLDVNFAGGGPTVGISRAIGNRARINLKAGTRPENTGVGVDIDLTRRLRLQSEIGPDGRASVGIGIEQEY